MIILVTIFTRKYEEQKTAYNILCPKSLSRRIIKDIPQTEQDNGAGLENMQVHSARRRIMLADCFRTSISYLRDFRTVRAFFKDYLTAFYLFCTPLEFYICDIKGNFSNPK
mgnify:CR=1 FL=1